MSQRPQQQPHYEATKEIILDTPQVSTYQNPFQPTFSSEAGANGKGINSLESSLPYEEEEGGSPTPCPNFGWFQ